MIHTVTVTQGSHFRTLKDTSKIRFDWWVYTSNKCSIHSRLCLLETLLQLYCTYSIHERIHKNKSHVTRFKLWLLPKWKDRNISSTIHLLVPIYVYDTMSVTCYDVNLDSSWCQNKPAGFVIWATFVGKCCWIWRFPPCT